MKDFDKILKSLKTDAIPGGKADNKGLEGFDQDELLLGIVEEFSEHTNNPDVAAEIAMDHLSDNPKYYSKDIKKQFPTKPKTGRTTNPISAWAQLKFPKKSLAPMEVEIIKKEFELYKTSLVKSEESLKKAILLKQEISTLEKSWFSDPSKMKDPYKQHEAQAAKLKQNKFGSSSTNNQSSRMGIGGAYQRLKMPKLKMSEKDMFNSCAICQKEDKPGSCECLDKSFTGTPKAKTNMALARKGPGKIKDESGKVYASLRDAANKLNINSGNISRQMRGDIEETGGHRFSPVNNQNYKKK